MAKKPEGKANWSSFTKAELIRTIKALDRRQTQLLNTIANLEAQVKIADVAKDLRNDAPKPAFPWASALPNPYEGTKE